MKTMRLVAPALLLLFAAACAPSGGSSTGTIRGQMTDGNASAFAPVSGAAMTAFEVEADGSLTALSETVTTDAEGRYELVVTFEGESISDVIVQGDTNGDASADASAIVSATLRDGGEVTAPPIDGETSAESEVFLSAHVSGSWDASGASGGSAVLRERIDATVAATLDAAADVEDCGRAIALGLQARAAMMAQAGVSASEISALFRAEVEAQAALDAALDAAASGADAQAAIESYGQALVETWSGAGLSAPEIAQSLRAQAAVETRVSAEAGAVARAAIREQAEATRADVTAQANAAAFAALGAGEDVLVRLEDAHATLRAAIDASAGVESSIANAWADYETTVEAELRARYAAIDTVRTNLVAAETTLDTAITAAGENVDAVVEAFAGFTGTVEATLHGDATLTDSQVDAMAAVLLLLR